MSPCGKTVVTGAGDETLRFWNIFPSIKNKNEGKESSLFPSSIDLRWNHFFLFNDNYYYFKSYIFLINNYTKYYYDQNLSLKFLYLSFLAIL